MATIIEGTSSFALITTLKYEVHYVPKKPGIYTCFFSPTFALRKEHNGMKRYKPKLQIILITMIVMIVK